MDNRNYDGILWSKSNGYWVNGSHGSQHVYVWEQTHQATVDEGDVIHHINEDREDNRIENLKLMIAEEHTRLHKSGKILSKSTCNKIAAGKQSEGIRTNNTSGYRGVCWFKRDKKWKAYINVESRHKYLGYFPTALEAAKAYDEAARKYFGDDCYQNLKQDNHEEQNEKIRDTNTEEYTTSFSGV
jgi:hypothetical protein